MTTRQYSSRSQQSTLTAAITSGATSMTVVSGTALLGGVTIPSGRTFTLVIDPDTALEEIVDATAVSTNTFTIARAIDGSTAQDHSAGAAVRHMAIGRDYRDANLHAEADASYNDGGGNAHSLHGIASGEGVVVGTLKTQTLTNKTLTSPTISDPTITGTASAGAVLVFEGTTADAYETTLTVVDPTQDNTITLPNTTGTVVIADATQTLTNKTLTSPVISGTPVITGLSSAGMVSSSATPKDYVDSILGSATAAATSAASAATSASSAATSASSASTSASNALTSANSASTSATAAATSASSAATSATAAATSAASAAASATAATTSATSAETSATAAATSASSASTSASSALTSANSASTSASSAATSASSASTSASSAATSASSAAASYDQFDDRYLGSKTSDPTVDNDGNPLITGALYFNSVVGAMKVYDGAAWDLVAPDTSNFIDKSILSGKGALISASGASTPVALTAPATNGWILSGDSATTSGLAWIAPNPGDITGVTAGDGISGGGTSGDVSIAVDSTVLRTTGGQVISANTSANALEIRQIGAGNAFVVEDETNPDSTPFVIAADGRVGIGTTSPEALLNIYSATGGGITVSSDAGANNTISRSSNDTTQPNLILRKSRGTTASKTIVQDGDLLANIAFQGYDGSVSRNGAQITSTVDGAPSLGVIPARITFATTDTAGNGAERVRINGSGAISINSTSSTLGAGTVAHQIGTVSSTAANVVEVIRGAASQTGNLTEWQNSSGTILSRVNSSGQFVGDGSQLTGISAPGGTAKIANNTESNNFTYNITLPAGAYSVQTYNSEGNLGANRSLANIEISFGTTKYSNVNWVSRAVSWEASQRMPIIGYTASQLTSVTINTYPSGTWTSRSYSSFGVTAPSIRGIVFGNGNFVIYGGVGASGQYVATSTDGVAWTSRTGAFGHIVTQIIYGDKFVGIGQNTAQVSTSTDGITWTSRYTSDFITNPGRNMLSYVPGLANPYFLVNGSSTYQYYVHSTDGITWASRTFYNADNAMRFIAGNAAFSTVKVAAFKSGTSVAWYQTSTDGLTWVSRAFPTTYSNNNDDMSYLAASNERYVFTGASGIWSSTDGITWTAASNVGAVNNKSVIWNSAPSAKWLIQGTNGQTIASTDGATWYTLDTQDTQYQPFAYGNGQWISNVRAVSGGGSSYYSSSGFGRIVGDLYVSIQSAGSVTTL